MCLQVQPQLAFRAYEQTDYKAVKQLMQTCFADMNEAHATLDEMQNLHRLYGRGQIVCFVDNQLAAALTSRIVPYTKYLKPHTLRDCANVNTYQADAEGGNSVYGLDVFVHPTFQNLKIGKKLVEILLKNCFEDNFYALVGTSRVVNYHKFYQELSCFAYAQKVKTKEIYDPALSFHYSYGMELLSVLPDFAPEDKPSMGFGVFTQILNPNYNAALPTSLSAKRKEMR